MRHCGNTVSPCRSLFGFILLSLTIVNASLTQPGITKIPVTRVMGPRRAQALHDDQLGKRHDETIMTDQENGYYAAYIGTSSASIYKLLVDTGSSYTWVGNSPVNPYVPGFAGKPTGQRVKITYDNDALSFTGMTHNDIVSLDNVLTINPQPIGVSDRPGVFDNPEDYDGILGLGPTALTTHIGEDSDPIPPIPTVVDSLYSQGTISHAVLGVYFMPYYNGDGGELSFGNIDDTVLASGVHYVPVTNTLPYWGVDASVRYRSNTILNPTAGIIDTGSSHIKLASDALSIYLSDTGAILNPGGWYSLTQDQYNNLGILSFVIGGQDYDLSPNAQIFPRASPDEERIFLIVGEQRRIQDSGLDFTLGYPFVERYYIILNTSSSQIGIASTRYTYSTTN
ncbi:hypothetical protein ID866_7080 [Astraeus odoratus]|nr:hypothetical protein ID866_7080 [Astraeus odoratus]